MEPIKLLFFEIIHVTGLCITCLIKKIFRLRWADNYKWTLDLILEMAFIILFFLSLFHLSLLELQLSCAFVGFWGCQLVMSKRQSLMKKSLLSEVRNGSQRQEHWYMFFSTIFTPRSRMPGRRGADVLSSSGLCSCQGTRSEPHVSRQKPGG